MSTKTKKSELSAMTRDELEQELDSAYAQGLGVAHVAEAHGVSRQTVYNATKALGIDPQKVREAAVKEALLGAADHWRQHPELSRDDLLPMFPALSRQTIRTLDAPVEREVYLSQERSRSGRSRKAADMIAQAREEVLAVSSSTHRASDTEEPLTREEYDALRSPFAPSSSQITVYVPWSELLGSVGLPSKTKTGAKRQFTRDDIFAAVKEWADETDDHSVQSYAGWSRGRKSVPCVATVRRRTFLSWDVFVSKAIHRESAS